MLVSKKLIHCIFFKNKEIHANLSLLPFYFQYLNTTLKNNIFFGYNLINSSIFVKPSSCFDIMYKITFLIKTKHLFLLTLYVIYTKLWKFLNLFSFQFDFLMKRQQKFTILRAPCNHKNSKEQFGTNLYSGNFVGSIPFLSNTFYHNYILSFFLFEKNPEIHTFTYFLKKNAKK